MEYAPKTHEAADDMQAPHTTGSDHAALAVMHARRAVEVWFAALHQSSPPRPTAPAPASEVIYPDKPRKAHWDRVIMLLVFYFSIVAPVRVCFDAPAEGITWLLEAAMTVLLAVDVVVTFRTAYIEKGVYITDSKAIARKYLTGWFWIDAPSSIPLEIIEWAVTMSQPQIDRGDSASGVSFAHDGSDGSELRLLRLFRMLRLLRLLKLESVLNELEIAFEVNLRPLRVVQLVVKVVLAAHMVACLFYLVGHRALESGEVNWISAYGGGSVADGTLSHKYTVAFYWSMTTLTTVGYGDLVPENDSERLFTAFTELFGSLLFAYTLGDVAALLANMDRQAALVEERVDALKEYLMFRGIPKELGVRVRRYYQHFYDHRPAFDERMLLGDLSPQLHSEVVGFVISKTVGKLSFFRMLEPEFQIRMFPLLKPMSFLENEIIYRKGMRSDSLLFVLEGEIDLVSEYDHRTPILRLSGDSKFKVASDGTTSVIGEWLGYFGESVLLGRRRTATLMAHTKTESLILDREGLDELFQHSAFAARHFCRKLLRNQAKIDRVNKMRGLATVAFTPKGRTRAAMLVQLQWRLFCDELALTKDSLYLRISDNEPAHPNPHYETLSGQAGDSRAVRNRAASISVGRRQSIANLRG